MNTENLHDAMEYIDDELISNVELLRIKRQKKNKIAFGILMTASAACICAIVVLVSFFISKKYMQNDLRKEPLHSGYSDVLQGGTHLPENSDKVDEEPTNDGKLPAFTSAPDDEDIDETRYPSATGGGIWDGDADGTRYPSATDVDGDISDEVPDDERPADSPETVIYVEIISFEESGMSCKVIDRNGFTAIYNGDIFNVLLTEDCLESIEILQLKENEAVQLTIGKYPIGGDFYAYEIERWYTQ